MLKSRVKPDEVAQLYRAGWALARLGKKYKVSKQRIHQVLLKLRVEMRPRGRPTVRDDR